MTAHPHETNPVSFPGCLGVIEPLRHSQEPSVTYREDGSEGLSSASAQRDVWDLVLRDPSFPKDTTGIKPDL